MKKFKNYIIILFGILSLFTVGCIHQHEWTEATCANPETCYLCGASRGQKEEHIWNFPTCETPKQCQLCGATIGEAVGHNWVNATCKEPKHCTKCDKSVGLLGEHIWIKATCKEPKQCTLCLETEGFKTDHAWSKGSSTTPKICKYCNKMVPLDLPDNGKIFIGKGLKRTSELTIKSKTTDSCYIKLKNASGNDVFSFFVKAGNSVTIAVPSGHYYVYFSYGKEWYGTKYVFGPNTVYSKDDELLDFKNYTWSYTLFPVLNGNFTETPIDANEFK